MKHLTGTHRAFIDWAADVYNFKLKGAPPDTRRQVRNVRVTLVAFVTLVTCLPSQRSNNPHAPCTSAAFWWGSRLANVYTY